MQGVRDYIKYIKRGYSRPSHLVAIDVRNGRLTKEEGQAMINEYEGRRPPSLDLFLDFIGMTEEQFLEIAMSHQISPNVHFPEKTLPGNKTNDFDVWNRNGKMDKAESNDIINRWRERNKMAPQ